MPLAHARPYAHGKLCALLEPASERGALCEHADARDVRRVCGELELERAYEREYERFQPACGYEM